MAGTTCYYWVYAVGLGGLSPASEVKSGRTLADYVDYDYDGWRVLEEREAGQTGPTRQFVYGAYLGEPLAMDVNVNADASCTGAGVARYYYHQNLNYSVLGLTNATGQVVEAYAYTPYGQHLTFRDGDGDGVVEFDGSDTRTLDDWRVYGSR